MGDRRAMPYLAQPPGHTWKTLCLARLGHRVGGEVLLIGILAVGEAIENGQDEQGERSRRQDSADHYGRKLIAKGR